MHSMRRYYIAIMICAAAIAALLAVNSMAQRPAIEQPHDMFNDAVQRCHRVPFDTQLLFMAQSCGEVS